MRVNVAMMHCVKKRARILTVAMVPLFALVTGCEPRPPTDADDVYDYVRNAAARAEVLRLDSQAQAYVDRIFHAYRMWESGCTPIDDVADLSKLLAKTSDEWRDTKVITERLAAIEKWLADKRDPDDAKSKTRAEWYQEVLAAIDDVPDLPGGTSCRNGELTNAISDELDIADRRDWLTRVAGLYKRIMTISTANAGGFSASSKGLAFNDAAVTQQAVAAWDATHAALLSAREAELRDTEETLTVGRERRERAVADKRELRKSKELTRDARRKQRELELLVRYYDARIRSAEARKKELELPTKEDE